MSMMHLPKPFPLTILLVTMFYIFPHLPSTLKQINRVPNAITLPDFFSIPTILICF